MTPGTKRKDQNMFCFDINNNLQTFRIKSVSFYMSTYRKLSLISWLISGAVATVNGVARCEDSG